MNTHFIRWGRFAAGATTAGLVVGLLEGIYRQAGALYAALLYGSLWALGGIAGGLFAAWLWRRRPQAPLYTWALASALAASTLVLVRFVMWRDVFQETPGKGLVATGVALGAALAMGLGTLILSRFLRQRMSLGDTFVRGFWLVPMLCLAVFSLRIGLGADDTFGAAEPGDTTLKGKGVVLLVVDTLRADALGAYGAAPHQNLAASPAFDSLAQAGLLFLDASAQASWTKPAMASIMTSRHPSAHNTMSKLAILPESLPLLSTALKAQGIKTAAVVTNYNLEEGYGFARGFDHFHYLGPARYLGAPERANRLAAYNVYRLLREKLLPTKRRPEHFYRTAPTVNRVGLDILDTIGNDSFFLWLHYMEPHDPYFATDGASYARVSTPRPPAAWAEAMHAAYRDDVHRFDLALGELLNGLRARGLLERTMVVVTSDHGEEFAEHGGFYHGLTLYEEQLHIPLLVAGGGTPVGVDATLARQIDIAPTIAAHLGVKAPPSWEGRNLFDPSLAPSAVLAEENHEGNVLQSIRRKKDKLILANPNNPRGLAEKELYNLHEDPLEKYLIDDAARSARLQKALHELLEKARQGGATATERAIDAEAEAQLRALGYIE